MMHILLDVSNKMSRDREIELENAFGVKLEAVPSRTLRAGVHYKVQGPAALVLNFLKNADVERTESTRLASGWVN